MNKENQKKFYKEVGRKLTDERRRRNISVAGLATRSGEQHKTISSIEAGNVCSLHHAVWMKNILGIDVSEIVMKYMEGIRGEIIKASDKEVGNGRAIGTIDDII